MEALQPHCLTMSSTFVKTSILQTVDLTLLDGHCISHKAIGVFCLVTSRSNLLSMPSQQH